MSESLKEQLQDTKFDRQLKLEREMQGMGVARFREEIRKARENELESTTSGVMYIMRHAFTPFCEAVENWKKEQEAGQVAAGRPGFGYEYLKDINTEVLTFITMRTVLDKISKGTTFTSCTVAVGKHVQNEVNCTEFETMSKNHYTKVKKDLAKRTQNSKHISTVLNLSAKKDDIELTKYSTTEKHKIGSLLISLMVDSTGLIELYQPPALPGKKMRKALIIQPTESTTKWLKENNSRCELLSPVIMPMIVEPKDWTDPYSGGYWSGHVQSPLIRKTSMNFLNEAENTEMWEVYQSINHLQKTKWSINDRVLAVVKQCSDNNVNLANLPAGQELPLPPKPVDMDTNREENWKWRKAASLIYSENVRIRSKYISLQKKIQVAERYIDEEEVFFVYSLDFRGRVYPDQVHLNPQGDDVSKALLHFAEGKAVDNETAAWLALHGANVFGYDKVTLEERVAWVEEHTDNILKTAQDPYENQWWTEADKPWQFLAFCYEWSDLHNDPENFVSHLPVALDGSCNGLQNFSAMLRDPVGGKATNLTPTKEPQDIYSQVADIVAEKVDKDAANGVEIAKIWQGHVNRKLVKRPTMTMPYGATLTGYCEQIKDEVRSWRDEGKDCPSFNGDGYKESFYLAKIIKDSLGEVVVAANTAMGWLQKVAKVIAKENLPIYWTTPVGFPVMQNYRNIISRSVKTKVSGKFVYARVAEGVTDKMDNRKMKAAIAPNFVHSCDASHLIRTVNLCESNNIASLSMVHDSFGTHAADIPVFRELLRHAFVQIHEDEPLQMFYEEMCRQSSDPDSIPKPPKKGKLDLHQVLEADFFFA